MNTDRLIRALNWRLCNSHDEIFCDQCFKILYNKYNFTVMEMFDIVYDHITECHLGKLGPNDKTESLEF